MTQQPGPRTQRQSLVFFPHQAARRRHLYDSLAIAQQARDLAIGAALGRVCNAVAAAVSGYFRRRRRRQELMAMDDRLLSDIGLVRGDIGNVISGRAKDAPIKPKTEKSLTPPAKPVLAEAVSRRAA